MITFLLIVATILVVALVSHQVIKGGKAEPSINLAETLLPEVDVHEEIAKIAESMKAQEPTVAEKPAAKPKKKAAPKKKTAPKTKKKS